MTTKNGNGSQPPQEPAQELKSFKATSGSPLTSQSWNAVLWEIEQRTRRDGDEMFGNVTASQGLSVTGVFSVDPGENLAALGVSQTGEVTAASLVVTGSASAQSLTVGDLSITSTGLQTSNLSIADAGKPTTVSIGDSATDSSLTVYGALTVKSVGFDTGPGKISVDGSWKLQITGTELKVQASQNAEDVTIAEFYDGKGERGIGLGSIKRAAAGKSAAQITALSKDTIQNIEILPRGTASTQGQVIVGQNTSGEKADLTVHGTVTADDIDINGKGIGDMGKWQTGAGNQDIYFSGGNVGIGVDDPKKTLEVNGDLQATGTIIPSAGSGSDKGIAFPNNIGGGSGDSGWIRYYARAGEHCTLEIGTSDNAEDHIALMPSGNVGIGIDNPSAKIHIDGGDLKITEGNQGLSIDVNTNENLARIETLSNSQALSLKTQADGYITAESAEFKISSTEPVLTLDGALDKTAKIQFRESSSKSYFHGFDIKYDGTSSNYLYVQGVERGSVKEPCLAISRTDGKIGVGISEPSAKLHVDGGMVKVTDGNIQVSEKIRAIYKVSNFTISLQGSRFNSNPDTPEIKINNSAVEIASSRGINTAILAPDGAQKAFLKHDIHQHPELWNDWADQINTTAQENDIVAVVSKDAIQGPPDSGSALTLLNRINATLIQALATTGTIRRPYCLLFQKGRNQCIEKLESATIKYATIQTNSSEIGTGLLTGHELKASTV